MPREFEFRIRHVATQSAFARDASVEIFRSLTCSHARPPPLPPPHHSQELAGGGERHRRAFLTLSKNAVSCSRNFAVHFADLAYRFLDPLGVSVPERPELGL